MFRHIIKQLWDQDSPDYEKLLLLLEHQQDWEANEARKAYVAALVEFKRSAPALTDELAAHGLYPPPVGNGLAAQGLFPSWSIEVASGLMAVTCTLKHELGHSESAALSMPEDTTGNVIPFLLRSTLMSVTGMIRHEPELDESS